MLWVVLTIKSLSALALDLKLRLVRLICSESVCVNAPYLLSTVVQGPSHSPLKPSPLNAIMLHWLQNCGNWKCVLDLLVRQDTLSFEYDRVVRPATNLTRCCSGGIFGARDEPETLQAVLYSSRQRHADKSRSVLHL
jgi:hypothetical protein